MTSPTWQPPRGRIEGLDGLRALAVLLVFLFHERLLLPFGWVGVQLFFVLSGFLITGILDRSRRGSLGQRAWHFYGRRTLRIFPLYYAYLGALALLAGLLGALVGRVPHEAAHALGQLPWAIGYSYNFLHAAEGFEHSRVLTHFWSLAVEEQFYLLWPAVIWLTPRARLPTLLWAVVLAGPPLRAATYVLAPDWGADPALAAYVLPWCQLDAFAWGALATYLPVVHVKRALVGATALLLALAIGTAPALAFPALGLPCPIDGVLRAAFLYVGVNLVSALILVAVVRDRLGLGLLTWRPLAWVGLRSYAIYMLHFPIQGITAVALADLPLGAKVVVDLALSLLAAEIAYRGVEHPFLRLKDRLFRGTRAPSPAARP